MTTLTIGNSTVNTFANSTTDMTQNSTVLTTIGIGTISVGNSTVNLSCNSTVFTVPSNTGLKSGTSSIAAQGYSWLTNGLLMQWGSNTTVNSTSKVITFPVAFPTAIFSAVATTNTAPTALKGVASVTTQNTTAITLITANTTNETVNWIVLGN